MSTHPYSNLPDTRFWSSGVKSPVTAQSLLAIDPLLNSLSMSDSVVSGGSCFAQYIGKELSSRNFNYLRSRLSDDRVESFGVGNIYTIAQLRQWLEFSNGQRPWSEDSTFEEEKKWYDYLMPHREGMPSQENVLEHRQHVKNEIISHLTNANVLVFTIGLTETWRNAADDVYPMCPGTLIGDFNPSKHFFHNCTFDEILSDIVIVENLLADISPGIRIIYTVSPVPLTATASNDHVLTATTYSKSVIRAALGQHCQHSQCASYFPSYELINHHTETDWRFSNNLRSVSESGVRYVMKHAFADDAAREGTATEVRQSTTVSNDVEAVCEEELLDNYSKSADRTSRHSDIVILGDSHMGRIATGFEAAGLEANGGMVMNGSGFSDGKFELSDEHIFTPMENEQSREIWVNIHDKLTSLNSVCHIITNIGFQTHRTISSICNHVESPVLTEADIADYFESKFADQIHILEQLTHYGKVWLVEDPDFYAFMKRTDTPMTIRDKNFHPFCNYLRKKAQALGIEYLKPCDSVLKDRYMSSSTLDNMIGADGIHGTPTYYENCATHINNRIRQ